MTTLLATTHLKGPHIDWAGLSPLLALLGGAAIVLLVGLVGKGWVRRQLVPSLALASLAATLGLTLWQWGDHTSLISGALRIDPLTQVLTLVLVAGGACTVLLAWRSTAAREAAHGEFHALLLSSLAGMLMLVAAQNTVLLFTALELLSIPLYVLCAVEMMREHSLESGLKYLIVGSVGSATLLYGLALIYGATGATDYTAIAAKLGEGGLSTDVLTLTGIALCVAGLAFKASIAPFHQWTPDVYEGAPTPVTAFMAVTTKVAAMGAFLRFFDVALIEAHASWGPALAALATITIIVGNVGALGQSSLKRMLAYSSVGQAGYMLAGVVVATKLGVQATVLYLIVYLVMNMAAFAPIVARERETGLGDSMSALSGLGRERPLLAWPMTLVDAGTRRAAGDRGPDRQDLPDPGVGRRRLRVARDRDRDRLDDLPGVLPAGDRDDVVARGAGTAGRAEAGRRRPRRAAGARGWLQRDRRGGLRARARQPARDRGDRAARGHRHGRVRDRAAAAVRPRAPHGLGARAVLDRLRPATAAGRDFA